MKPKEGTAALADVIYYVRTHLDAPLELSVATIGMDAGYDSPSAFSRVFAGHFGVTPSEFRANGEKPVVPAHALPAFRNRQMEYRVEELPSLRLLAVRRTGRYRHSAPAAFRSLPEIVRRLNLIDEQATFLGLSYDSPDEHEDDELRYDACITSDEPPVEELHVVEHDAGRYAIYRHQGPYHLIEHAFDRLLDAAILSGAHQLRDEPFVEINLNDPATAEPKDLLTDVCIPVV